MGNSKIGGTAFGLTWQPTVAINPTLELEGVVGHGAKNGSVICLGNRHRLVHGATMGNIIIRESFMLQGMMQC